MYVPNTAGMGHVYFKQYFFPQSHKDTIILDERFNGGGLVADYYIDILKREYVCMWNMRYGADLKTPSASIQGPKVMLINESEVPAEMIEGRDPQLEKAIQVVLEELEKNPP